MTTDITIDYESLWQNQVGTTVPAEVSRRQGATGLTFVKLPVPLIDRWGQQERQLVCRGDEHWRKRYVEVLISGEDYEQGRSPYGEVLRELDSKEYSDLRIKHDQHALRRAIDNLKSKTANIESQVSAVVEERLAESQAELNAAMEKLAEERVKLKDKEASIPDKIRAGVGEQLHPEREKLAADKADAKKLQNEALERLEDAQAAEKRLASLQAEAETFRQAGGPEFMRILHRASPTELKDRPPIDVTEPPDDLFKSSQTYLRSRGYDVDEGTLARFILAAVTAMGMGQFVLLSGPTGVGKTSLVRRVAELLGAGPDGGGGVIPVRPAWLDPADLVGFYNSASDRYEPTPFIDELVGAQRYAQAGESTFLVLDEMNLARIENYGADLLALLEKSRENLRLGKDDTATLQLYADAIASRLDAELMRLIERRKKTNDTQAAEELDARIGELHMHLDATPARLPIPPGVVLFGTLNADETTYALSPKVKDRSFVLQLPALRLAKEPSAREVREVNTKWFLTHGFVSSIEASDDLPGWATEAWDALVSWQDKYFSPLGVHLSRRFASLFRFYTAAAVSFGLPTESISEKDVASGFLAAKLLPWIAFHKEEETKRSGETVKKAKVLADWAKELTDYPRLESEVTTILDQADLTYEYVR